MANKQLVILSGPSCVGKGPLLRAFRAQYGKGFNYAGLVLCNSRKPRTGEVHGIDYYFLPRGIFSQLSKRAFIVGNVRSDIQAIDITQVEDLLKDKDIVIAEIYYTLGQQLIAWLQKQKDLTFSIKTISLVPLSSDELQDRINAGKGRPNDIIYRIMKKKLKKRGTDTKEKIEERAQMAYSEIIGTEKYTHHIVCHAGEDDKNEWSKKNLGQEARRVLNQFMKILKE